MKKEVKIKAMGADFASVNDFIWFQGNLKTLSEQNYNKLKKQILELGFSEPVSVWMKDNDKFLLNGHQRVATLKRMQEEGYQVPYIPYNIVEAENEEEARRKVLSLTSEFGKMTEEGLAEFLSHTTIELSEIKDDFALPALDFDKVAELQLSNPGKEVSVSEHTRVIGADFEPGSEKEQGKLDEKAKVKCPNCKHEFEA